MGSEFKIRSSSEKLIMALTCFMFPSRFLWVSSIPFGTPSLPLLNRIAAVSSRVTGSK